MAWTGWWAAIPLDLVDHIDVAPADLAVGLGAALERAGVPVPPQSLAHFATALRLVAPDSRQPLYWAARVTLISSPAHLAVFDAVFSAVFDGLLDPADSRGDPTAPPSVGSEPRESPPRPGSRPQAGQVPGGGVTGAGSEHPGLERDAPLATASHDERLRTTSFAELDPYEVAQVRRLVRQIVLSTPDRVARRTAASARRGGRLDLRRTLRAAQHTGGEPVHLVRRARRPRPRRLVLLCDVSGSMEPFSRVFLSLLQGAVAGAHAEAFVFATRLTRLTRQLAVRNPDQALARAAATAPDWSGGTRLAESLRRFLDDHGRRGVARGAVVVVLSDGWAQDDPELVAAQMARLRRLTHRIVWVNPRKAARDFAPLVGGMAAALPYCDAFISGHTVAALNDLAAAIPCPPPPYDREDFLMQLDSTFAVTAPIEQVWSTLMDFERVAGCVPGAEVTNRLSEDAYQVGMKVKLGPVTMQYKGQMEVVERDATGHRAVLKGSAKEARGQGTAQATAQLQLVEDGDDARLGERRRRPVRPGRGHGPGRDRQCDRPDDGAVRPQPAGHAERGRPSRRSRSTGAVAIAGSA